MKKISRHRVNALVDKVRKGDASAFRGLVAELEPYVKGAAMKVCRDPATADEAAQDTLVAMYRKLHQYDRSSLFSTWIYSIVVNNCRMRRRRGKMETASVPIDASLAVLQNAEYGAAASPEMLLLADELRRVISAAVDALPEDQREVFVLRDLEHLSTEETALTLGLTESATKSRLHRARANVREVVAAYID